MEKYIHNNITYPSNCLNYLFGTNSNRLDNFKKIDCNKLNNLINENYEYFKDIPYDDNIKYILSLIGTYYGLNQMEEMFYNCIENSFIINEDNNTNDLYIKTFGSSLSIFLDGYLYTHRLIDFDNKKISCEDNLVLVGNLDCNNNKKSEIRILDDISHELRHLLCSIKDSKSFINNSLICRMGLQEIIYNKNKDTIYKNNMIDEFYNVYFNELIVNQILDFKNYDIKNKKISEYIKILKSNNNTKNYFSNNYVYYRLMCYPMLENAELTDLIKYSTINGNINEVKKYFSYMNVNFDEFSNNLDNCNIDYIKEKSLILSKNNNG